PQCPFFLFTVQASATRAQVSWWRKKKPRFSSERPGYNAAVRVARLGADGVHLEQAPGRRGWPAGGGGLQRGLRCAAEEGCRRQRLPGGDGICITSLVSGLGVQLGDTLFLLPGWATTVAVSFTEKSFKVPTKFTEEPINLIKKLYKMYEEEEQDAKAMQEHLHKDGCGDRGELVCLQEEQERGEEELMHQRKEQEKNKRESLRRNRDERNRNRCMRKEVKKMYKTALKRHYSQKEWWLE
ncbi:hypothetical protein BS78_06G164900, partial [Paspalum vaginatum]